MNIRKVFIALAILVILIIAIEMCWDPNLGEEGSRNISIILLLVIISTLSISCISKYGIRTGLIKICLRLIAICLVVLALIPDNLFRNFGAMGGYMSSAMIQQLIFFVFFFEISENLIKNDLGKLIPGSALYILIHIPNWSLVWLTATATGLIFIPAYHFTNRRWIWAVWIGVAIIHCVLGSWLKSTGMDLKVGIDFLLGQARF